MQRDISSLPALEAFAHEVAAQVRGGDVVGLVGDLGAGKTTFVQFFAKALGVQKQVTSPTFTLMQDYAVAEPAAKGRGVRVLRHIDAYRIDDPRELDVIGAFEGLAQRDMVIVLEWADKMPSLQELANYREYHFSVDPRGVRMVLW